MFRLFIYMAHTGISVCAIMFIGLINEGNLNYSVAMAKGGCD